MSFDPVSYLMGAKSAGSYDSLKYMTVDYSLFAYDTENKNWYLNNVTSTIPDFPATVKGIVVNCTNGGGIFGGRYYENTLLVYGIGYKGTQLDGSYEFTTLVLY